MWPIDCHECRDLRSTNICAEPFVCELCGSDNVAIFGERISAVKGVTVASRPAAEVMWGDFYLSRGPHPCPRCKNASLSFSAMGGMMFD
jgi:hypothetical protein